MSGPTSPTFEIARPTGRCAETDHEFEPGEHYVAVLVETPDEESLARLDYSEAAWNEGARPEPPARVFASWKAVTSEPNQTRKLLIEDDELMDLFDQLAEGDDQRRLGFRYLLALILIRKRKLVYEGAREGVMFVRVRGTPQPPERGGDGPPYIEVVDPGLDEATIEAATEQLGQVMLGDDT